ncbi:MAG: NADH-quinone oxidoreductase subunit C [Clostridiales Family XIII bacterium]|jgi:ech hydrogenase subunit D|nr:NADH-quinone oxidoreductase subunit C [Clostridiales Family XIII bacterium]
MSETSERKDLIQDIRAIEASDLLASVADVKTAGYRLGQACATKTEGGVELLYSFEKDEILKNLKVSLDEKRPEIQSISGIYWPAFIYENEMHDLFGVTFKNLALDYGGHFFKTAMPTPWNPAAVSAADDGDVDDGAAAAASADDADTVGAADETSVDTDGADEKKGGEA